MPRGPRGLVPKLQHVNSITNFPKALGHASARGLEYFERPVNADERAARYSEQTQNDRGGGARRGASSRFFGIGIKPSRWACFLAALRVRRMASAFSRVLRSDGFSYALRRFISRKTPSRCIFFLRTLSACDIVVANDDLQDVSNLLLAPDAPSSC